MSWITILWPMAGVGVPNLCAAAPSYPGRGHTAMGEFILRGRLRRCRCHYRYGIDGHASDFCRTNGDTDALDPPSPSRSLDGNCLLHTLLLRCRPPMTGLDSRRSAHTRVNPELYHGTEPVFQRDHRPQAGSDFWLRCRMVRRAGFTPAAVSNSARLFTQEYRSAV